MNIIPTKIEGVFILETNVFQDDRGIFVKTFNKVAFAEHNLSVDFTESFYSISNKNVIRGMHIQVPPKDHSKLVYVTSGKVIDVVLDIRVGSPTYGQFISTELSADNRRSIYMPPGCVHGFVSLEDNTCTVYLQTATYDKTCDTGIKFDSFGMDWSIENPIISTRDLNFETLENFQSPFIFRG